MSTDTPLQVRMLAALDRMEAATGTRRWDAILRVRAWVLQSGGMTATEWHKSLREWVPSTYYDYEARVTKQVAWEAWREACGLARIRRAREQDAGATLFQGGSS